jgi:hypothetical protein
MKRSFVDYGMPISAWNWSVSPFDCIEYDDVAIPAKLVWEVFMVVHAPPLALTWKVTGTLVMQELPSELESTTCADNAKVGLNPRTSVMLTE